MSIDVNGVTKKFGDFVALDDVTVSLPTGQLTALLGPSGGGKSTLLRIIAGLDKADAGTVSIEGIEATKLPPQKRNVGFVFQHYAVFKHMTVAKNVAFGLEIRKRPKDEVAHRVDELLRLVHLQQFSHRLPSQLSGGQRQRMALARALAVEPKVLLLDEPFGALDAKVRKELREWLRRLHDEVHVTTVFVTHDQEEALEVADEIVVINEGRVEQIGTPDELYDEPANDFVMGFLGEVTNLNGQAVRPHDIDISPPVLDSVHLQQFSHRLPSQLSGGQRQRMALARALAVEPKVLLLDEPFGALDAKVRKELREWLRRLHDEVHVTTVFVTHDQEEALEVSDEIVVINEGRVEQIGSPDELYDNPANDFVMGFLGEVTHVNGQAVRPHDVDISTTPILAGAAQGSISRILRVGFEVRVSVLTDAGEEVAVQLTKSHANVLELQEGQTVWVTPNPGSIPSMSKVG